MTFSASIVASRPSKLRSAITNDPFVLAGIDGRSAAGRRYRDIIHGLLNEYGDGDLDRLRELAALKMTREAAQFAAVSGDPTASENLVRVSNVIARCEKLLRARARQREAQAPQGLRAKLSSRYNKSAAP